MSIGEQFRFFRNFVRHPMQVGSLIPSSRHLAKVMVESVDWSKAKAVLEYGPGTGVFTEAILAQKTADCQFAAIERSPDFVRAVQQRCPTARVFEDSIENVEAICKQEGIESVDAVLSGIPWAIFPEVMQKSLLEPMLRVLKPGGHFATFTYVQSAASPPGIRFRKLLNEYFTDVQRSSIVWRNFPPAFVYRCHR